MEYKAPEIYEAALRKCETQQAPIFYVDISYNILTKRGKTVNRTPELAEGLVLKGFKSDFNSLELKEKIIEYYFDYQHNKTQYKKVKAFDLSRVELKYILFLKIIGFGVKQG